MTSFKSANQLAIAGSTARRGSSVANVLFVPALALTLWMGGGCGSSSTAPGTGGASGSGGANQTGSGGRSGTGGSEQSGTGGQSATGGQSGTGGQTATGGESGAGARGGAGASQNPDAGPPLDGGSGPDEGTITDVGADGRGAGGGRGGGSGGGGRGGDAGGGAGAVAFAPCPTNGTACIILPLGDSITDGFPFENGGYRVELFNQAVLGSHRVTFVGSLTNGPTTVAGVPFPRSHEGHSGFTIDNAPTIGRSGISPLTDNAISTFRPHIILLLIGTNDLDQNLDVANAPTRLAGLIDRIIRDSPSALLVVGQVVPTTTDAENVRFQTYNAAIPALVQTRATAGKHILRVDMYSTFTANAAYKTALMNDNLHPNAAGYALLGRTWYTAIRSYLP